MSDWKSRAIVAPPEPNPAPTGDWKSRAIPAQVAPQDDVSLGDKVEAGVQGFGQGAAMGYQPQLQAVAGGLIPDPNAGVNEDLKSKGFTLQEPENNYLSRRDAALERDQALQKQSPGAYTTGQVGGVLASAPMAGKALSAVPGLALTKNAGLLSNLAKSAGAGAVQGAVQNPGDEAGVIDPLQAGARASNAKTGAIVGLATQGGVQGVKSGLGALAAAPSALQKFSQAQAFKAAGAMLKDFRSAYNKGRVGELGQEMIDSGLVQPGMTFEKIAEKSGEIRKTVGESIGAIYDTIKSSVGVAVNRQKMATELIDAVSDPKVRPKINTEAYDGAMQKVIDSITQPGKNLADVRHVNDLIGELDDMINHSKRANEMPTVQQGYLKIRQFLRNQLNTIAEQTGKMTGDPKMGQELKELNKRYGNIAEINRVSRDRVARESANRMFGLTDTIAGVGGAAAGAVAGQAIRGNTEGAIEGGAVGLGLGLLNKVGRKYGVPLMTTAANKVGGIAQKISTPSLAPLAGAAGLLSNNASSIGSAGPRLLGGAGSGILAKADSNANRKPEKGEKK